MTARPKATQTGQGKLSSPNCQIRKQRATTRTPPAAMPLKSCFIFSRWIASSRACSGLAIPSSTVRRSIGPILCLRADHDQVEVGVFVVAGFVFGPDLDRVRVRGRRVGLR